MYKDTQKYKKKQIKMCQRSIMTYVIKQNN